MAEADAEFTKTLLGEKSLAFVIACDLKDTGDITEDELIDIKRSSDQAASLLSVLGVHSAEPRIHRHFARSFAKYDTQRYLLPISSNHTVVHTPRITTQMRMALRRCIDPNHGLLPQLLAMDVLGLEEYSRLNEIGNTYDKTDKLLDYCNLDTDEFLKKFLESLEKTNQKHVANFFRDPGIHTSHEYPLNERYIKLLCKRLPELIEKLVTDDMLLNELIACECITSHHRQAVKAKKTSYDKNTLLFEIMMRRSAADLKKFGICLKATNQCHLRFLVSDEGANFILKLTAMKKKHDMMKIDIQLNESSVSDKIQAEKIIVERFKRLLGDSTDRPSLPQLFELLEGLTSCRRRDLCNEMKDIMKITHSMAAGIELILLEIGHSIRAHFFCKSLEALADLLVRDNLTVLLKYICICLNDRDEDLDIDTITWREEDFLSCTDYLRNDQKQGGEPARATTSCDSAPAGTDAVQTDTMNNTVISGRLEINYFPIELLEMIVVKSTIAIFVATKKKHQKPEKKAVRTIRSVCSLWSRILTYRRYNALQLYLSFNERRPYPRKVKCKIVKEFNQRHAVGVTVCGGKLYVLENLSNEVTVYQASPPFKAIPAENITIPGLLPRDIASCEDTKHLYVADRHAVCVWQVSLMNSLSYEKFASPIEALSLFVESTDRRLLVTSANSTLSIFKLDGARSLTRLQLSRRIDVLHAVMTSTGRIYVCHTGSEDNNRLHQVSEVDMSGRFIRHYGSERGNDIGQLHQPSYLALHGDRRVIVADHNNGRVLVLNAALEFVRVLLQVEDFSYANKDVLSAKGGVPVLDTQLALKKRPFRLQYIPSSGRMFVSLSDGTVHISELSRDEHIFDKRWMKTKLEL